VIERVPFDLAIADPQLLKAHFDTLSVPQQVVLKAFNGLPLSEEEQLYWAMLQGNATYDELGYPTSVTPLAYVPKKYHTLAAILGRRSGKTDRITSTQLAYEALLGGHMNFVERGQDVKILFIAQDIGMAASHLNFIHNAIRSSPKLYKELDKFNADAIILKNGLQIEPAPPTITSSRGLAVPGWAADETGFWYTDPKAANPDYEVERAVEYAMSQFPDAFKLVTSTPYTKQGMLWEYNNAGTEGVKLRCDDCTSSGIRLCPHRADDRVQHEGVLVVHAPTAAMENPRIDRRRLVRLQRKDPDAFIRESLAQFVDSLSGFLSPDVLRLAIMPKVYEVERFPRPGHPEDPIPYYIAAMDPAFRHDKFAFTVMHHDLKHGIVQDYFQEWTPELGSPLNPTHVLTEIRAVLSEYGLNSIYSDQYQLESLQQLALNLGFSVIGCDFTAASKAKIYGSFASLVNQRRIKLLDKQTIYEQLVALEKRRTPNGAVTINAPAGKYDDAAAACALCAHQCIWLLPQTAPKPPAEPSLFEQGMASIRRAREIALTGLNDDD
jgi:hypothetical protein